MEKIMSFNVGHTTFGFTMRVPDADAAAVDELISSHAAWMQNTHSLVEEEGKLHTLEYYVSKASELIGVIKKTYRGANHKKTTPDARCYVKNACVCDADWPTQPYNVGLAL